MVLTYVYCPFTLSLSDHQLITEISWLDLDYPEPQVSVSGPEFSSELQILMGISGECSQDPQN